MTKLLIVVGVLAAVCAGCAMEEDLDVGSNAEAMKTNDEVAGGCFLYTPYDSGDGSWTGWHWDLGVETTSGSCSNGYDKVSCDSNQADCGY